MKRIAASVFLAGFAASCANPDAAPAPYEDWQDVYAKDAASCPIGFIPIVRSYERQGGRFVETGYLCHSLYRGTRR